LPLYLLLGFGNAVFAAMGFAFARHGVPNPILFAIWLVMIIASVPPLIEMASIGFGEATQVTRMAMHITVGDLLMFATLLLLIRPMQPTTRLAVYAISFVALVALGSRTSLYAFAAALPAILLFSGSRRFAWIALPVGLVVLASVIALAMDFVTGQQAQETRMFAFFSDAQEDTAWTGRIFALQLGLADIASNPILGSFGSHFDLTGEDGSYIHNYLEMWRQFGILPFALFVALLATAIAHLLNRREDQDGSRLYFLALFGGPILLQVVFSRSYGYPHVFFILGFVAFSIAASARRTSMLKPLVRSRPGAAGRRPHGL
jgi:O-antigen ligase